MLTLVAPSASSSFDSKALGAAPRLGQPGEMLRFAANLGMLFGEVDFLERFALAAQAGFAGVEYPLPYVYPAARLRERLEAHHLTQVLLNLPAGNWDAGERGVACDPERR